MRDGNTTPIQEFFRNRTVWVFFAIDIIAIIIAIGVFANRAVKVSTINFNVVPINATISVNGDTHYSNGQYDVAPGNYEIKISHDNLETKTLHVELASHDYANVTIFLTSPNKSFDFYEQRENYESYKKLKSIASIDNNTTTDKDTSAQDFIADLDDKLSIFEVLPLKGYVYTVPGANMSTGGFSIESGQNDKNCQKSACLVVKYFGKDYESEVPKKIREAGYNPDDYQLVYERRT